MPSWWAETLAAELSQGDVIADQAAVMAASPPAFLKAKTIKGGELAWTHSATPAEYEGRVHMLATGSLRAGLIISHGCELDKLPGSARRRVLMAPIFPLGSVSPEHQEQILSQENKALMPLPLVPGLGDMFADLRSIFPTPRADVDAARRIASMTKEAELRLHAQLVAFFLRLEMPQAG